MSKCGNSVRVGFTTRVISMWSVRTVSFRTALKRVGTQGQPSDRLVVRCLAMNLIISIGSSRVTQISFLVLEPSMWGVKECKGIK
jgi:hypothetical protein